ncbi:MAG TPA: GGDEF domain-containing protein [Gaiellaceae bacterium]|jgi:diguanylate cyclase (GGDEF)-like protein|nr:GGDEF domain-containing protein [Gaiellaceae bacterium]
MTADTSIATTEVEADDPLARVADAIREALPGPAGEALLARVADILAEPLSEELEELALENARLHEELAQAAATDPETGLRNRRRFFEDLRREFASARRYGTALSLVAVSVDELKGDGEQALAAGGDLMRTVGESLLKQLRVTDISARVGDADLAVILPQTPIEGARRVAERLVETLPATVSVGVSTLEPDVTSAAELLDRADRDLGR